MRIKVTSSNVEVVEKEILNNFEYNVHQCEFEFSEEYEGLSKKALFTNSLGTFEMLINHNKCEIPYDILKMREITTLGVYASEINEDGTLKLRYSPSPCSLDIDTGSFKEDIKNSSTATPTELEQIEQALAENSDRMDRLQESEDDRVLAEETRADAEQRRSTAEETRAENEQSRISAETDRADAEIIRKKNESDRIVNENGRVEAENNRRSAETARQTAENERIANEQARQTAEENRETNTTNAINQIQNLNTAYEQLAEEKTAELTEIAEGIEDLTTSMQFPIFDVEGGRVAIIQTEKLKNTNFGVEEGRIYKEVHT